MILLAEQCRDCGSKAAMAREVVCEMCYRCYRSDCPRRAGLLVYSRSTSNCVGEGVLCVGRVWFRESLGC